MMTPRKPSPRPPQPRQSTLIRPPPPKPTWKDYIPEHPGVRLIAIASSLTALLYIFGFLKPIIDSGPLPLPSRSELTTLHTDMDGHIETLKKGVDETLEVAKAANMQAQQAIQQTTDFRLDRLLQQKIQLTDQIAKNPNDQTLKASLARTDIDIQKLTAMPTK